MKGITVKYFKSWDKVKDIVKGSHLAKNTGLKRFHTYKVYFDDRKVPIKLEAFNKNGEQRFIGYPCYSTPSAEESDEQVLRENYIYRKKNDRDVLENAGYHFILCNEKGQELEHEIWEGDKNISRHICEYNTNGERMSEIYYDRDGSIKSIYKYDTGSRKTSQIHYEIDGSIGWIRNDYYDEAGRVLKEEWFEQGLHSMYLAAYNVFHYNKGSKCIKKEEFTGNNKLLKVYKYKYSKEGKFLEEKRYRGKSKRCEWQAEYLYDKKNNLLVGEKIYMRGKLFREISYTYDTKGHLVRERDLDSETEELDSETIYKYNSKDQLIDEKGFSMLPDGVIVREHTKYQYDDKGRLQYKTCRSQLPV